MLPEMDPTSEETLIPTPDELEASDIDELLSGEDPVSLSDEQKLRLEADLQKLQRENKV